jgi:hypothetical protein
MRPSVVSAFMRFARPDLRRRKKKTFVRRAAKCRLAWKSANQKFCNRYLFQLFDCPCFGPTDSGPGERARRGGCVRGTRPKRSTALFNLLG